MTTRERAIGSERRKGEAEYRRRKEEDYWRGYFYRKPMIIFLGLAFGALHVYGFTLGAVFHSWWPFWFIVVPALALFSVHVSNNGWTSSVRAAFWWSAMMWPLWIGVVWLSGVLPDLAHRVLKISGPPFGL